MPRPAIPQAIGPQSHLFVASVSHTRIRGLLSHLADCPSRRLEVEWCEVGTTWGTKAVRNRNFVLRFLSEVAIAGLLIRLIARLLGARRARQIRGAHDPPTPTPVDGADAATSNATAEPSPALPSEEEPHNVVQESDNGGLSDETQFSNPHSGDQTLDSSQYRRDEPDVSDVSLRNRTTRPADNPTISEPSVVSPAAQTTNAALPQVELEPQVPSSETPQHSRLPLRDSTDTRAQTPIFDKTGSYQYNRHMGVTRFVRRRLLRRDDPFELGLVCKTCHIELPKSGRCDYCE